MLAIPPHCLDEDGEYDPSVDILDAHRLRFEIKIGLYEPPRTEDRNDEWLQAEFAKIEARLLEQGIPRDKWHEYVWL